MPLMTNAEAFRYDFGIYATELWAMTEAQFLEWLNADCDRERPVDMVVRCKDCKYWDIEGQYCDRLSSMWEKEHTASNDYCSRGERKEDEVI